MSWFRIHDCWYYVKCWVWYKYNRITVKTLPPTWCDRCSLLPHVMFQILSDFVEKECSPGSIDWNYNPDSKAARAKMDELLKWWIEIYLKQDSLWDFFDDYDIENIWSHDDRKITNNKTLKDGAEEYDLLSRRAMDKESELQQELKLKLKDLIDIQDYLWT